MKVLLSIKPEYANRIFDGTKKFEYRRSIFKDASVTSVVVYASAPVQKVIGEFEIDGIRQDSPEGLWRTTGDYAGIAQDKLLAYFSGKASGYAIEVGALTKYPRPRTLRSFAVKAPPQSFVYI